jgi:uncharacterized protein with NAD-binding domain and iron-sulfur cluster
MEDKIAKRNSSKNPLPTPYLFLYHGFHIFTLYYRDLSVELLSKCDKDLVTRQTHEGVKEPNN